LFPGGESLVVDSICWGSFCCASSSFNKDDATKECQQCSLASQPFVSRAFVVYHTVVSIHWCQNAYKCDICQCSFCCGPSFTTAIHNKESINDKVSGFLGGGGSWWAVAIFLLRHRPCEMTGWYMFCCGLAEQWRLVCCGLVQGALMKQNAKNNLFLSAFFTSFALFIWQGHHDNFFCRQQATALFVMSCWCQ
jgi:hypothetical protein